MRSKEREPVLALLESAFGFRGIFLRYMERDPRLGPEDTLLALVEGRPVACVQIFSKWIRLRGETVGLGGIGSVATADAYRKRGLASTLVRRAIQEMERRGMALSLLFTGLLSFYQRLGFVPVPQPRRLLHRPLPPPDPDPGLGSRAFTRDDLPAVRDLYETYSASFEASTVRDTSYWESQLGYAGNPDEDFRLAQRDGRIVAYTRCIEMDGTRAAIEFARARSAAAELAALLLTLTPAARPLVCPRAPDPELDAALEKTGARLESFADPTTLWRVLDRPTLVRLSGLPGRPEDEALLTTLAGGPRALYWPSDRF